MMTMTVLYRAHPDGGFTGELAGTRLQIRTATLNELSERAQELHQALVDSEDRFLLALVPCQEWQVERRSA